MKIWLTTDTHFGHVNMIDFCGRPKDFDVKIFRGLRNIPMNDMLIHLGDVCMGNDAMHHAKWIQSLPVQKRILVMGNHDRKSPHWYMEHGWSLACESFILKEGTRKFLLSHKPQASLQGCDMNIHGHFHNTDFRRNDSECGGIPTDKHRLLALEYVNYQPVSFGKFAFSKQIVSK